MTIANAGWLRTSGPRSYGSRITGTLRAFVAPTPPAGSGIVATSNQLTINLTNGPVTLTGNAINPANWQIIGTDGSLVAVNSVTGVSTVVLTTNDQKIGLTYTLNVPFGIIGTSNGLSYTGPFIFAFSGSSSNPTTLSVVASTDDHTVIVTFSKAMNQATALNPQNYSIDGGVLVLGVIPVSPAIFKLTTSGEQPGVTYHLTPSSNIQDLAGNSLV